MISDSSSITVNLLLQFVLVSCVFLVTNPVSDAQSTRKRDVKWIWPVGRIIYSKGYEVKEEADPSGVLNVYINRNRGEAWIPLYINARNVGVALGHLKQLALINDCPATKFCKVVTVDLTSRKSKQVDLAAIRMYQRHARADDRLIIIPQAYAFSPDDSQAVINMELIYISVPGDQKELADRLNRSYKNWWYVVDSTSGRVLREYRTTRLPRRWWVMEGVMCNLGAPNKSLNRTAR